MDRNIKAKFNSFLQEHVVKRKAMFIPIAGVATFMLVGYAAVDKEEPVIVSDSVQIAYGEKLDTDVIDITDNRTEQDGLTINADTSSLDVEQLGEYEVEVTAADEFSNITTKTVKVSVVDQEGPKFNVVGASEGYVVEVPANGSNDITNYIHAEDNADGDVTAFIQTDKQLDTTVLSSQDIELSVTDTSGNTTTKAYTFVVADTQAPTITPTHGTDVVYDYGKEFLLSDFITVTDNFNQDLTIKADKGLDTILEGETQTIKVTAEDSSNNVSELELNFTVKDLSGPTLQLTESSITANVGDNVNLAQYVGSSVDTKDGDTKGNVSVPTVDTTSAGTKSVTYSVKDAAGNETTANLEVKVNAVAVAATPARGNSSTSSTGSTSANTNTKPVNVPSNTSGSSVLSAAYSKLGTPYVYGATGPNAFDCSGFTQWCYRQAGKSIGRTSGAQGSGGTRISISQAQPGDILWRSGHVGIYIGGNTYIHAPHTGDVVRIASGVNRFSYAVRY